MSISSSIPLGDPTPSLPNDPSPSNISYNSMQIAQAHCEKSENSQALGSIGTTIHKLSDNALLEIFSFCVKDDEEREAFVFSWEWLLLVHVCRRWRQITFASPRRLDLQILCTYKTLIRKNLYMWPAIPIIVQYSGNSKSPEEEDNIIAALGHTDRISHVWLVVTKPQLEKVAAVMQKPLPVLTWLSIRSKSVGGYVLDIPGVFLGGSASCLQKLELIGASYRALPTFLSSTSDLVELTLRNIPTTGYVSPEVMVAQLAGLPRLKILHIGIQTTPYPDRISPPPITCTILPSLREFSLTAVYEYVEDFVSRINTPQLDTIDIYYWPSYWPGDNENFYLPRLSEFIRRSEGLKPNSARQCDLTLHPSVSFSIGSSRDPEPGVSVSVRCEGMKHHILHLSHMLGCISPILPAIFHLSILASSFGAAFQIVERQLNEIDLLHFFKHFPSMRTLFVSKIFSGYVSRVLGRGDIAVEEVTEVFPSLDLLCLEEQPVSSVDGFIAARRDSGRPVTVVNSMQDFDERFYSYL